MSFLKSCVETLLSLATFNFLEPYDISGQKPLIGSNDALQAHIPDTTSFEPSSAYGASPGFKCVYPQRWKPCNTATSRDCWLQDTQSADEFGAYSQIDIHTDCKWVQA